MNTTILIRNETRELLKRLGRKNQTYDQLINELIKRKGRRLQEVKTRLVVKLEASNQASPETHRD